MAERFRTMRLIEIDAAHRVPDHGSKCRSLHGHRYRIEAHVVGELAESGEQTGMTIDFGFLKQEMMTEIDDLCDHGIILRQDDPLLETLFDKVMARDARAHASQCRENGVLNYRGDARFGGERGSVFPVKFYLMLNSPTAENLAREWFERLAPRVVARSEGRAKLERLRVWETPNCYADYPA